MLVERIEEPNKDRSYFFIVFVVMCFLAAFFYRILKPIIIETGCSDIALKSSNISKQNRIDANYQFSYSKIKEQCIKDAYGK